MYMLHLKEIFRKIIQIFRGRPIRLRLVFHLWTSVALNEGGFKLSSKFCFFGHAKQESNNNQST